MGWILFQKTKPKEVKKMFGDKRDQHILRGGMDFFTKQR